MNTKLRATIVGSVIAGAAALTLAAPGIASAGPRHMIKDVPAASSTSTGGHTATGVSAR